ncbi:pentatricopeptide repeat-containing protein At5g39680-like [Olea europaea var. sylvestris]|uniref:Pentatricopeptide repeat-containing At5g39680 n=1 Tax=Olea europaea subsp. europaea TaxID=158383 RepID=A0A8S0UDW6_OLEEU|nr:pentatricopeptide repeat-containing protein At5g39680-like [Olea europaea var. sylvestris]CAA3016512.1 pentatricopeptide repeat-containing At5g39680 [Olea europaea subsp. europaea]
MVSQIQRPSFVPNLNEIRKFLKVSADSKNLTIGKTIHAHLIVSNQDSHDHVIERNSLINLYSKCGEISIARQLFVRMRKRNVVSWGSLMAGYLHHGLASEVIGLCRNMVKVDKLCLNKYILATVISCCSHCVLLDEGQQCHGYALKSGLSFHRYVKNALVSMYSMCSDVKGAMQVLYWAPRSDLCTYNSILNVLLDHGYMREAFEVLCRLAAEYERLEWDSITYVNIFGFCARIGDLILGQQTHSTMLKIGVELDLFVGSAVIDMYGKCGEILSMRNFFKSLQTKNVVTWTAILAAYLQNECFEEVLKLFLEMEIEHILPNEYTFAVLLHSCSGLSALGFGNSLHARIVKMGMKNHIIVSNVLIHMYSRCGLIEDACIVFTNMTCRDVISWNCMITGYSHHGLGRETLAVFHEMLAAKEQPNYVTFVGALSACAFLGRVNEGFYYLNHMMRELGIEPGLEHYTCIVGLLGRAGRLEDAVNFMQSTPIKWDIVAWRTLLNACCVHHNYHLGKQVAETVLHLNPEDMGACILLSNMHAKAKRWDRVVEIRKLMRERNVKKEPGLSWTEIRNNTQVFVSGDNDHPESVLIREKVKELLTEIKPLGYVPTIACELHDVEEEQKEDYLGYHSEKLAIAYVLMKTPPMAPIRIIKNLRMCVDCHSAIKFISKVTNRVIIVRDVNRFHSFREGCCSCTDYW